MRIYYFIITLIISFCVSLQAQNNADKFKQQAQSSFENKDYTKARYLYIQAYKDYANEGKITQAISAGLYIVVHRRHPSITARTTIRKRSTSADK